MADLKDATPIPVRGTDPIRPSLVERATADEYDIAFDAWLA